MVDKLLEQLKRHEGFRKKMYKDTLGLMTIGYGTNLEEGLTKEEASLLLVTRLGKLLQELGKAGHELPSGLGEVRDAALANMAYNLGVKRLLGFTKMWQAIADKDYDKAANEMLDSKWARQVGNRAEELAKQMRTGLWNTK